MNSELIAMFGEYGIFGLILGVTIWNNLKLQNRLFKIIENCTKAITNSTEAINELKSIIQHESKL